MIVGHRIDDTVVSVLLLSLELKCTCHDSQKLSDLVKEGRFGPKTYQNPKL